LVELEFENVDFVEEGKPSEQREIQPMHGTGSESNLGHIDGRRNLLPRCEERKANLTGLQAENKAPKALGHAASIPEMMNIILYNNTKFEGGKENGKVPSRDLTWPASPLPVSSSVACQS